MQKKQYSSPEIELILLSLTDTILSSVTIPTIQQPTDEYGVPIFGKRPSMKDELEGDGLVD